jgi:formylglycine-generating enzyme required for sulfatase activity
MDDLAIPRKRSQGDYWRGDLLRTMLFFESSQRDFVSFALRRGYDFEPHLPIEEPPILPPSVVPVEERVDEKITDSPSVIQPVSERFWVPLRYLVDRFAPETDLGIHGLDKTQSREVAVIGDAQIQQPQVKYLAAWPELRNRLDPLLGFPKRTRRLDTEALIKRISRGDPIRQIPFYERKRTHDQITVIKEHALHCAPYRLDQEMVVEHLSKATARGGLQVLDAFFPYGLTNPESGDSSTVIRRQVVEPTPGSHILVLGDLGLLLKIKDPFDRDAVEWWYRACRRWSSRGCKVFALVPLGYERVPAKLRAWVEPIAWQGDAVRSLTHQQQEQGVTRLLTMAYPAQQIEPGLLREFRRLCAGLEDASIEARFWQDWRHGGPRYDAVKQTEGSIRKALEKDFEKLDDLTITQILRWMRHYRIARGYSVLWQMELMNLPKRLRDLIDPNSAEQDIANQTYQALCFQMHHGGTYGLRDRLMSLSLHASEHAIEDSDIGSAVRTIRNGCLPDAKRSDRTRFVELPPSVETRKVQIECNPSGIGLRGVSKSASDSMLVGSSNRVTMASGRPVLEISVPKGSMDHTIKAFWKSGRKPDWVSGFGRDDYGLWCEFQVPRHDGEGVVTQRMRWIKPGTFMMGSPEGEEERYEDESPWHRVTLTKGFWMADTQVTQELWMAVSGRKNPSHFEGGTNPVERVSWEDCEKWISKLCEHHAFFKISLPSEAQWEYVCRAGSTTAYCFGDDPQELLKYSWFEENSKSKSYPVKQLLPNGWGLYDMHGNVWEWCRDWYGAYEKSTQLDPTGPTKGTSRVIRGGSWVSPARVPRSACRGGYRSGYRGYYLGFRIASSALGAEPDERAMLPEAEPGTERASSVQVRVRDTEPVGDPREIGFWKSGKKPDWVSAFGKDDYGLWYEFQLPNRWSEMQAKSKNRKGTEPQGFVTQRMRWIKPGKFMIGSDASTKGLFIGDEEQHEVTLTQGFWMADAPCTQGLWMGAGARENRSRFQGFSNPVERVSWEDCQAWLKGLGEVFPLMQPALPTEAQWEYACRAGSTSVYCFGDSEEELKKYAWYDKNSRSKTHVVGAKLPNAWGLYDVHGNVWEWCQDWYGEFTKASVTDPVGPPKGTARVIRGGSWDDSARYLRSACRSRYDPGIWLHYLGFRLLSSALGAEPSEGAMLPEAEPGTERARIGSAELDYGFLRSIDLDATGETTAEDQFSEIEVNAYTSIRVVSDQEGYQFDRLEKPDWAVEFGHDSYGLYSVFEVAPEEKGTPVRQKMRWIPPGRFLMGSAEGRDYGRGNESPEHEVVLTQGYWMFDTPCTQGLWTSLMGGNPSYFVDPERPVERVSWEDASGFAQRLNGWFGKRNNKPSGKSVIGWSELSFRLPTEAEWEYACRAGTKTDTYLGDLEILGDANAPLLDRIGWYGGNSGRDYDLKKSISLELDWLTERQYPDKVSGTQKVAGKVPNGWGLYDMLGNVWEWCEDWDGEYSADRATDPINLSAGSIRVIRGGSWDAPARYLRSACGFLYHLYDRRDFLGFRLLSSARPAKSDAPPGIKAIDG